MFMNTEREIEIRLKIIEVLGVYGLFFNGSDFYDEKSYFKFI